MHSFKEIPKAYNPKEVEDKWYKYWEEKRLFHSEPDPNKKPYTIVIPPPNITGILHLGHVLNNTIQDIYIRYKRMQGYNACWVPGTDHASIATEAKVVQYLKSIGIDKNEISREEFLEHCKAWQKKYGGIIIQQLKKLGVSCDWERERFTMDDHYYKKVIEAFVYLYKKGYIFKGHRMVNWCPVTKSAISDEEVIFQNVNGKLWHFKYPIKDSNEFVVVATTRPETMLGDTGVAVNPDDERYSHLIGKYVVLPIVGREIPIFADSYVDKEFGTGVVKVTPAHDVNDYEMGLRHNLEIINIFTPEAKTNENVPEEFRHLDRYEAREKVVKKLEELGLLVKVEDYNNKVGYSQRGNVPIEPYLSEQWFMRMDELAKPALEVVMQGKVKLHPEHWIKTYEHWMTGIKDWCISRQLYWGHRIPVWYHKETNEIYCDTTPPKDIENWEQESDVLDTWASSWLWAQDVFTTKEEQAYYYPTDLLVTGPDIIFFWVARMIIAGMEFMKDIPFKDVYFTSIIRDDKGRKMSKSLGNSPDPLNVIDDYGADALRFTINFIAPLGQDVLFSVDKCDIGRNFANKIWNAGRYLLMNAQNTEVDESLINKHMDFSDRWILSKLQKAIKDVHNALDKFEINNASKIIYSFIWNDFCDWFIEISKPRLYSKDKEVAGAVLTRALWIYEEMLKLVHPFMPFISEELWQSIKERKDGESISIASYPVYNEALVDEKAEAEIEMLQNIVTAIRNIRGEMNLPITKPINVILKIESISEDLVNSIKALAKVETLTVDKNAEKPKAAASAVVKGCDIFVPMEGLIDLEVEKQRIEKEINRLEGLLQGVNKKLSNPNFVDKAPAEVVANEKNKKADWEKAIEKLKEIKKELN